jgi:hypothetical protein
VKTLIAVVNARHRQSTWAQVIRDTWMPFVPRDKADALFFVGRGEGIVPADTIELDCDDTYQGLPEKIRAIVRWASEHEYEYMLKCDDDTVLDPGRLLDSGYELYPYTGRANRPPNNAVPFWVPMGFNYWLSKRCMEVLRDAPLPSEGNDDERWVATNLFKAGICLKNDDRYRLHYGLLINLSRPIRINRPLRNSINNAVPGEFSWCVFLEGNSGNRIPTESKLAEFKKVFVRLNLTRSSNKPIVSA